MIRTASSLAALSLILAIASPAAAQPQADMARVDRILKDTPLIDGHNDWAETRTDTAGDKRWAMDLTRLDHKNYDTDIERLRQGRVGGQFWSAYVSASLPGLEEIKTTLEQIDLIRQLPKRYPKDFALVQTAAEVRAAYKAGKIASMIGVEGGNQIDEDLSVLRAYHDLGAGYLTLTHFRTISWADSATDTPVHGGLTPFGKKVVGELNRLGMLVDLSHVSENTMKDAIAASKAPVIFSHSSARALSNHTRNVSDEVLGLVAKNGGIVMVNFAPDYVSEARRQWSGAQAAEKARLAYVFIGEPDKAAAGLTQWLADHPKPVVTIGMVADHIDHIAKVAGYDNVGLGGDYDGLPELPQGMDGVEAYPQLLIELMRRGWSDANLKKLAGENILRVMASAEKVAASMAGDVPASGSPADDPKPAAPAK